MVEKDKIIDVLKQCFDPEIPIDLTAANSFGLSSFILAKHLIVAKYQLSGSCS